MVCVVILQEIYFYLLLTILVLFILTILGYFVYSIIRKHQFENNINQNTDYFSRLAHDLKSPLAAIDGYAFLSKQCVNDPQKILNYLDRIEFSSKYMQEVIDDTVTLSKINKNKEEISIVRVNLKDLINLCLNTIEVQLNNRNIQLEKDIDVQHYWVMTDGLHLTRIIMNLLNNAMKYTNEFGKVWFQVKEIEKNYNLSLYQFIIKDTGCGMSKEFQKRVFEPFVQERRISTNIPSSGLGLYIVKKFVDLLHGEIIVESEENVGSCFTIKLELHHLINE